MGICAVDCAPFITMQAKSISGVFVNELTFRLNEGNVKNHRFDRLTSFVTATAGCRITYEDLTS